MLRKTLPFTLGILLLSGLAWKVFALDLPTIEQQARAAEYAEAVRLYALEKYIEEKNSGSNPQTMENALLNVPQAADPQTETAADPQTETAVDPQTQTAADPQTQIAVDPQTQTAVDPQTQIAVDPQTQAAVDPQTEMPAAMPAEVTAENTAAEQSQVQEVPIMEEPANPEPEVHQAAQEPQTVVQEPSLNPATQELGLDFALLAPSTQMTFEELVGDNGLTEDPAMAPPAGTYKIEVDLVNNVVIVFDADGDYIRIMRCTTGKKGTSTPKGSYKIGKGRKRFGYFDEFNCYAQYWTQVVDGIYFHSVLYNKRDASTLIRSSYRNMGRSSSHGCIRLTVPDARWIYQNIAPGTEINMIKKEKDQALQDALALPPASSK